jgi:hypothetical protein
MGVFGCAMSGFQCFFANPGPSFPAGSPEFRGGRGGAADEVKERTMERTVSQSVSHLMYILRTVGNRRP